MQTLNEFGNSLFKLSEAIDNGTKEFNKANEIYLTTKAMYENEVAKAYLSHKAKGEKVSDTFANTNAETENYALKMELVKAESQAEAIKNLLRAKRDKFEAIKEQSYNLRAEIKKFE